MLGTSIVSTHAAPRPNVSGLEWLFRPACCARRWPLSNASTMSISNSPIGACSQPAQSFDRSQVRWPTSPPACSQTTKWRVAATLPRLIDALTIRYRVKSHLRDGIDLGGLRCFPTDECPRMRFARSAMNYWADCTAPTRTAPPRWLQPLRRISGRALPLLLSPRSFAHE